MRSKPDVSVIIPCYNAAETLGATIASVRAQTHANWHTVCVDDGSTDCTPALLDAFATADARIERLGAVHGGLAATRNVGLRLARASRILFLDADDVLRPDAVEVLLQASDAAGRAAVVAGGLELLDHAGRPLGLHRFPSANHFSFDAFLRSNRLTATSLVPVMALGPRPFDETLPACEDWDLWLRLAHAGTAWVTVPRVIFGYRLRPASLSHKADLMYRAGRCVLERWLPHARNPRKVHDVLHRWAWACGALALAGGAPGAVRRYFADLPPLEPGDDLSLAIASDIHWAYLFAHGAVGEKWGDHAASWLPGIERWLRECPLAAEADRILDALARLASDPQDWADCVCAFVARRPSTKRLVLYGLGTNGVSLLEQLRGDERLRSCRLCVADDHAPPLTFAALGLPREDPRRWESWPASTLVVVTPNDCDLMRHVLIRAGGHEGADFIHLARSAEDSGTTTAEVSEVLVEAAHLEL